MGGVGVLHETGRRLWGWTLPIWESLGPSPADLAFSNREAIREYDFALPGRVLDHGVSAMLRVLNEEQRIWDCLASIVDVFDEILVIDNGSSDSTVAMVHQFKERHDSRGVIKLVVYPVEMARAGQENRQTPEDSIHSLAYWYNWCLSRCRYGYVCKWDADMLLLEGGSAAFRKLLQGLSPYRPSIWRLRAQSVYRDTVDRWFLARDQVYAEVRIFPNRADVRYHKAQQSEKLVAPRFVPLRNWPLTWIYEIKDANQDEFSHWSPLDRLPFPGKRKQQEWRHLQSLRRGDISAEEFVELDPNFLPSQRSPASTGDAISYQEAHPPGRLPLPAEYR